MSDYFSGWNYHRKQPWVHHWSHQNVVTGMPFAFSNYHYHYVQQHQPDYSFAKLPPPTANLHTRTWGRGGAKAYFRFHGGIGDGCCGIACRYTEHNTVARPLQLFDALNPVDFQISVIGPSILPVEASGGTGVFLPVYPNRIRASKGDDVNNNIGMHVRGVRGNIWQQRRFEQMKQEDTFSKHFEGGNVVEKKEHKDVEDVPLELLLPSEWTY